MQLPYTPSPLDAVMIAHSAVGATVTAVLWQKPLRPLLATFLFLAAVWLAVSVPIEPDALRAMGVALAPDHVARVLRLSSLLACAAMLATRPRWLLGPAVALKLGLDYALRHVTESNWELAGLHLLAFGLLLGIHRLAVTRPSAPERTPTRMPGYVRHDLALFFAGTALAALVSSVVLDRFINSGDEWANTYQADLFAHLKAYGPVPECPPLHQNYWVFFYQGRAFAQYTPGWPLVMTPFHALGLTWLAAPVMLGLIAVAVARLARRCAADDVTSGVPRTHTVAAAGWFAGLSSMLGVSMLLNAGSRFPHAMVCAGFAWSVEAACAITGRERGRSPAREWALGALLGSSTSLLLAARPADGATLGLGIFLYFAYALARRRVAWRALLATALAFALWAGLALVILHAQLGEWFKSGYSIAAQFWPWAQPRMSLPLPNQYKYGVPLATGAYCWWPCAPALGAAGLVAALRGPGRRAALMLGCGALAMTVFYVLLEFGRTRDSGYGPRFYLPLVAPMAVGGGALLAPLWAAARVRLVRGRSALRLAGPATLAAVAVMGGTVRIAPLVYPAAHEEVHRRSAPLRAIAKAQVHHAVVTVASGDVAFEPLDLTQNLPSDPDPDVVILIQRHDAEDACGRREYSDRYWYRAYGQEEATLIPYEN